MNGRADRLWLPSLGPKERGRVVLTLGTSIGEVGRHVCVT